jgi:predicted nucleotidyltransferase component of viral defense system
MTKMEDFNTLVERAMSSENHKHMRPVIEKELLHYDILFAIDKAGLIDKLTFQGGTSLRLCYGAPRFSEDLDFVGGSDFAAADLLDIKVCIEHYIGDRYGFEISVKQPKDLAALPENQGIKVDKWQVRITTSPGKRDLPKQKIKLEVANVPAYSRIPKSLQSHYEFLPDGYGDLLIMTETLDEIMADKLVFLVSCQRYIRNRDIWDLRWLRQQGAQINGNFVLAKINDYKENEYPRKLNKIISNLDKIIHGKDFQDEIKRFIPIDVQERTLLKEKFLDFLTAENNNLLSEVDKIINGSQQHGEFQI